MALFSSKPKKETKKAESTVVSSETKKVGVRTTSAGRLANVILAPWFSEKALIGTEKGVYVFSVPERVTKKEVKEAIEKIYKVIPRKVALLHLPGKKKALRTRRGEGQKARRHKAYVYLKKGETITFA